MAACEDSASIDCAREMRGTSSMAKLVMPRALRARTDSRPRIGLHEADTTTAPA